MLPARPRLLLAEAPDATALFELATGLGRPQRWMIADPDATRIDAMLDMIAGWARRAGLTSTWPGRALLVHAPGGAWRIEGHVARPDALIAPAVVDAVILDRATPDNPVWAACCDARPRPILLARRCPTGRIAWWPASPADRLLHAPQTRRPETVMRELRAAGCTVRSAVSDMIVRRGALGELQLLIEEGVASVPPWRRKRLAEWQASRMRQALASRLTIRIFARDIMAWDEPG